jgi:hypothetical protein
VRTSEVTRPFCFATAVLFLAAGLHAQAPANASSVLRGTIDIHVHSLPDSEPWTMDGIETAKQAKAAGMRAIVLKSHWEPTATLAYMARKEVPGLEVFGGICLSRVVGGINSAAVEDMARVTGGWGRVVWMPTSDAENNVKFNKWDRPYTSVSRNGELLPEVKEVIGVIAKNNLVLATGHSTAEEDLMLVHEAKRQGVQHVVVTHAMSNPVKMNIAQMKEAAATGSFIELVYVHTLSKESLNRKAHYEMSEVAEAIRAVGPQSVILSTDMGQVGLPSPTEGLASFITELRALGFSQADLDKMAKENPAKLLGLAP